MRPVLFTLPTAGGENRDHRQLKQDDSAEDKIQKNISEAFLQFSSEGNSNIEPSRMGNKLPKRSDVNKDSGLAASG